MVLTSSLGTANSTLGQGMILGGQVNEGGAPIIFPSLIQPGVVPQTTLLTRAELQTPNPTPAVRHELNRRGG